MRPSPLLPRPAPRPAGPARTARAAARAPLPAPLVAMLVALVALAACAPSSEIRSARPLGEVAPPIFAFDPDASRIERFDPPGAGAAVELSVGARVSNPNEFPVRIEAIDYVVLFEGRQVGRGRLEPDLFLTRAGSAPLSFALEVGLGGRPELLRAVARAFADDPLALRIEGRMTFSSLSYRFTSRATTIVEGPVRARQSVRAPTLRLDEAASRVYRLRPDLPIVAVAVVAANPGDIGWFLSGRDLELQLAGWTVAVQDLQPVPVPAGGEARFQLLFYPDAARLPDAARRALEAALGGTPTALDVTGRLRMDVLGVDSFEVPQGWRLRGFVDSDG